MVPLEAESTLTNRYQTTVPETVRRALNLGKRDKIRYTICPNGDVILTRADLSLEEDPVLGDFLDFLACDMSAHPEHLQAVDSSLMEHLHALVGPIDVDLDEPLRSEDE